MLKYLQITTTVPKLNDAKQISDRILNKKLASCVQIIGPIKSIYWWKNKIEKKEEWLCIIKTRKKLFKIIEKFIKNIHPYEVPEIIATPIINGSIEYFNWIYNEVKSK